MATVTSLTATRIQELLAGWESVGLSQDEINALVVQLQTNVLGQDAKLEEFNNVTKPKLEMDVTASAAALSNLTSATLPLLEEELTSAKQEIQDLVTVTIPSLQADMTATMSNVEDRPNVYVQNEPPSDPDDFGRFLVVGDSWFDSDDNNRQRIWNGVEWTTFNVDVADFSLTVKSFVSSRHQLL